MTFGHHLHHMAVVEKVHTREWVFSTHYAKKSTNTKFTFLANLCKKFHPTLEMGILKSRCGFSSCEKALQLDLILISRNRKWLKTLNNFPL